MFYPPVRVPVAFCSSKIRYLHLCIKSSNRLLDIKPLSARIKLPGNSLSSKPEASQIYLKLAHPSHASDINDTTLWVFAYSNQKLYGIVVLVGSKCGSK